MLEKLNDIVSVTDGHKSVTKESESSVLFSLSPKTNELGERWPDPDIMKPGGGVIPPLSREAARINTNSKYHPAALIKCEDILKQSIAMTS